MSCILWGGREVKAKVDACTNASEKPLSCPEAVGTCRRWLPVDTDSGCRGRGGRRGQKNHESKKDMEKQGQGLLREDAWTRGKVGSAQC